MTTRLWGTVAAAAMAAGLAWPGLSAAADSPRYVLETVPGGFIRMDTRSGSLSHCAAIAGEWTCRSLADDRRALQDEIAALEQENGKLRSRIEDLEASLAESRGKSRLELPSDTEIDRLMGMFERMMRRFMDFARTLDGDKGDDI